MSDSSGTLVFLILPHPPRTAFPRLGRGRLARDCVSGRSFSVSVTDRTRLGRGRLARDCVFRRSFSVSVTDRALMALRPTWDAGGSPASASADASSSTAPNLPLRTYTAPAKARAIGELSRVINA